MRNWEKLTESGKLYVQAKQKKIQIQVFMLKKTYQVCWFK